MHQKCILAYDDDIEILNIVKLILGNDYQIETRSTSQNLFEDIDTLKPHLILMDLRMPFIDGEQAVKLLKANNKTKDIPVVVFSASLEIEKISKRINATAMIKKPFNIHELREIVRNNIKLH